MMKEEKKDNLRILFRKLHEEGILGKTKKLIMIELNGLCNAQCIFCSREAHVFRASENLETPEIEKLIEGKDIVTFLGGEPLMDRRLPYLLEYCKSKGQRTSIITNGVAFCNKDLCESVMKNLDFLTISIPSLDPVIYNRVMGFEGFSLLQEALLNIAQVPYRVFKEINLIALNSTIPGLSKVPEYLFNLGIADLEIVSILYPIFNGRLEDHPLELPDPKDSRLSEEIKKLAKFTQEKDILLRGENCSSCLLADVPFTWIDSEIWPGPEYVAAKKRNNEIILYPKGEYMGPHGYKHIEACNNCRKKDFCYGVPKITRILFSNDIKPL